MTTMTISLPDQIAKKVNSETRRQGYATRSEFMRSLLREYFAEEQFELEEFQPQSLEKIRAELAQSGKYSEKFIDSVVNGLAKSSKGVHQAASRRPSKIPGKTQSIKEVPKTITNI